MRKMLLMALLVWPLVGFSFVAGIRVTIAPPAPREESAPPPPAPAYLWIPGYWAWRGGMYVWVPGHWAYSKWEHRPGHWRREDGR
jgi:hypothetical protein